MAKTVGELIADRLVAWGVRRVFAYPGDGIKWTVLTHVEQNAAIVNGPPRWGYICLVGRLAGQAELLRLRTARPEG